MFAIRAPTARPASVRAPAGRRVVAHAEPEVCFCALDVLLLESSKVLE